MKHINMMLWLSILLLWPVHVFSQLTDPYPLPPIADGHNKFLGNIYASSQLSLFTSYWNQVTPENAGKWGSVEGTRDQMNWGPLDASYDLAKDNGFPFRFHVLVWGNQQPSWIAELDSAEQIQEIEEWFTLVAERYPGIDYLEVVNEPLHDPPSYQPGTQGYGNYMDALGGTGETGWDWVLTAFKMAREIFPDSVKLMLNEYNILSSTTNTNRYIEIIELLQAEDLIDVIGVQGHAFSTRGSVQGMVNNLNLLAETGLPIQVTEMDIDGPSDYIQLLDYQRIFPALWEHQAVEGITLWGWRIGMWRTDQGAFLIRTSGEKPALTWLRAYVTDTWVPIESVSIYVDEDPVIDLDGGTLQLFADVLPDTATITNVIWNVNDASLASINANGLLTANGNGTVVVTGTAGDGSGITANIEVTITNQSSTSIDVADSESFSKILVYPNPTLNGNFAIKGIEKIKNISIMDIRGITMKEIALSGQQRVEVRNDLPPGIYIIRLFDGQNTGYRKVIIQ